MIAFGLVFCGLFSALILGYVRAKMELAWADTGYVVDILSAFVSGVIYMVFLGEIISWFDQRDISFNFVTFVMSYASAFVVLFVFAFTYVRFTKYVTARQKRSILNPA